MKKEKIHHDLVTQDRILMTAGERRISRFLLFFEDCIKVPLFHCQHCGECILSHTAFVCCQRCPKRMRNGPCGGTGADASCEVYPDRPCIWLVIHRRAKWMRRLNLLNRVEKIHNWNLEKTSAWLNVLKKRIEPPVFFVRKKEDS